MQVLKKETLQIFNRPYMQTNDVQLPSVLPVAQTTDQNWQKSFSRPLLVKEQGALGTGSVEGSQTLFSVCSFAKFPFDI